MWIAIIYFGMMIITSFFFGMINNYCENHPLFAEFYEDDPATELPRTFLFSLLWPVLFVIILCAIMWKFGKNLNKKK